MGRVRRLNRQEDAFGQEIWACFKGKESCEIVERDDGYFSAHQSSKVYFSEFKDWPIIEQKAVEFVKGRVLDVGCGAGRHSLYLQEKGFDVLGIDVSPVALKVSRLRGLRKTKTMPIENLDFKPNSFDTVIMFGGNFGLLGNPKRVRTVLKRLYRMTSSDASILAETRDPYKTDNPHHLEYQRQNRRRGRMRGQTRIRVRFEKTVTRWFEWLIASRDEMEQMLRGTGWTISQIIDSEDPGYIAVLKKCRGILRQGYALG